MELAVSEHVRQEREESSDDDSSSSDDYADMPSGPIDPEKCLASGPGLAGGAAGKFFAYWTYTKCHQVKQVQLTSMTAHPSFCLPWREWRLGISSLCSTKVNRRMCLVGPAAEGLHVCRLTTVV